MHKDPGVALLSVTALTAAVSGQHLGLSTAEAMQGRPLSAPKAQRCARLNDSLTFWEGK